MLKLCVLLQVCSIRNLVLLPGVVDLSSHDQIFECWSALVWSLEAGKVVLQLIFLGMLQWEELTLHPVHHPVGSLTCKKTNVAKCHQCWTSAIICPNTTSIEHADESSHDTTWVPELSVDHVWAWSHWWACLWSLWPHDCCPCWSCVASGSIAPRQKCNPGLLWHPAEEVCHEPPRFMYHAMVMGMVAVVTMVISMWPIMEWHGRAWHTDRTDGADGVGYNFPQFPQFLSVRSIGSMALCYLHQPHQLWFPATMAKAALDF